MIMPRGAKIIWVDIYRKEIMILSNEKQMKEFEKLNKVSIKHFWNSLGSYVVFENDDGVCYFVMASPKWTLKTLVHECVHVAYSIMDEVGVPISKKNTEAEAYLVEHIFQESLNKIKVEER